MPQLVRPDDIRPVRRSRRRIDVSSLIWGLLFLTIAAAALWIATGHELRWAFVRVAAPVYLVCLGILGVVLSRRHHR